MTEKERAIVWQDERHGIEQRQFYGSAEHYYVVLERIAAGSPVYFSWPEICTDLESAKRRIAEAG
jgi:hypothetical protein